MATRQEKLEMEHKPYFISKSSEIPSQNCLEANCNFRQSREMNQVMPKLPRSDPTLLLSVKNSMRAFRFSLYVQIRGPPTLSDPLPAIEFISSHSRQSVVEVGVMGMR